MTTEQIEAFYRDATAADVARVMNGEEVEARFRDYGSDEWQCCGLAGWYRNGVLNCWRWATSHMVYYRFCQVYDPPQWWLDKPEPGEEYRLLKKFPAEDLQGGDEVFRRGKGFEAVHYWHSGGKQIPDIWYRRKVEQPKLEPKFAVGQKVKIVGPPINGEGPIYNWCGEMDKYIGATEFVRSQPQQTFEGVFYQASNIANWSFREDYLEAVVEPKPEPKQYTLQVGDTISLPSGHRIIVTDHGIEVQ